MGKYYHREFGIYQEWFPELRKMRDSKGLTQNDIPLLVAEPYYFNLVLTKHGSSLEKDTVFVFEDLKSKGYQMNSLATTPCGIDYDHAQLIVQAYANYHALSISCMRSLKRADGTYQFPSTCAVFREDPNYVDPVPVFQSILLPSYSKILRHFNEHEV